MSARWTMFLRAVAMGCFVVAMTAVAQNDPQQGRDEHQARGQQRQSNQNGGQNGQQQYRPEQQQGRQQNGQPQQQYQQRGQQPQQQYPQGGGQQQYQQRGQQPQQQYQQRGQQPQPQYQQRGQQPQQQYQQRGQQPQYQQRGEQPSNRGGQQYRPGNRPQQWGRPPASRPSYSFRPNDRNSLRRYYAGRLGGIDRAHRPSFRIGSYLPYEDLAFISPVPPEVWGSLPPIPYGYVAGYWNGYVIVYDPETGYILYVTDLMY